MSQGRVMLVDDTHDQRVMLAGLLVDEGYEVRTASTRTDALQLIESERFDVAVLDVRLDESDEENVEGLLLMRDINALAPDVPVIILTGHPSVSVIKEALRRGENGVPPAFDFLEKAESDQLPIYVGRAIEKRESVQTLISQGEGDRIEFKSSARWDIKEGHLSKEIELAAATAVAGMLNSKGGHLLIGVADDGRILGIEQDQQHVHRRNQDGYQLMLLELLKTYLGIEAVTCVRLRFEQVGDQCVCVLAIAPSPAPIFLKTAEESRLCVRVGNSTRKLDVKEALSYIKQRWSSTA